MGLWGRAPEGHQAGQRHWGGTVAEDGGALNTETESSQVRREAAGSGTDRVPSGSSSGVTWLALGFTLLAPPQNCGEEKTVREQPLPAKDPPEKGPPAEASQAPSEWSLVGIRLR